MLKGRDGSGYGIWRRCNSPSEEEGVIEKETKEKVYTYVTKECDGLNETEEEKGRGRV